MKKGSIIGQIVKEISLANYDDDTPLSHRVEWFLGQAIPEDIYHWFMAQIGEKPLSGKQGRRLVEWLCKDVKKAIINQEHIKKIRKARREDFLEILRENLPSQAVMVNITAQQLEAVEFNENVVFYLVPFLSNALKRDEDTITIGLQWCLTEKVLTVNDLHWMTRYCKPVNEFQQLLLLKGEPLDGNEPSTNSS